MNPKLAKFQETYQSALRLFCDHPDGLPQRRSANLFGAEAIEFGFSYKDTLNAHTHALLNLLAGADSGPARQGMIARASTFYGLMCDAVEEQSPDLKPAPTRVKGLLSTLLTRTGELTASNKKLKDEIQQRKAEEKLKLASEKKTRELLAKSLRMEDELRRLSRKLLVVQEEERKKLSRELRDVIAQALSAINVRLTGLQTKSAAASADLRQKIETTRLLVQQTVEIVHRFARELCHSALDDLGFIPALQSHLKTLRGQSTLRISLRASPDIEQLEIPEKIALFRVIQESLYNVIQHAEATQVSISITSNSAGFRLAVRDNGKGFSIDEPDYIAGGGHLGLLGMRERIEMIGGTFQVESRRGRFTTIRALLPRTGILPKNVPHPKPPRKHR
jgi:signal transduction histidine kinase